MIAIDLFDCWFSSLEPFSVLLFSEDLRVFKLSFCDAVRDGTIFSSLSNTSKRNLLRSANSSILFCVLYAIISFSLLLLLQLKFLKPTLHAVCN